MYNKIINFLVCKWPGIVAQESIVTYLNIYAVHSIPCVYIGILCIRAAKCNLIYMYCFSNAKTLSGAPCGDVKF